MARQTFLPLAQILSPDLTPIEAAVPFFKAENGRRAAQGKCRVTDKFDPQRTGGASRLTEFGVSQSPVHSWFLRDVLPLEAALMAYFGRHWSNKADLRDMVQDVYVRVCEAAAREIPQPSAPFVFATARNLLIDRYRSLQVIPLEAVGDLEKLLAASEQPGPERAAIARDELRRLQTALDQLPARYREALVLQKIEGLSRREIAIRMGVGEETVKSYLADGLFAMANAFLANNTEKTP